MEKQREPDCNATHARPAAVIRRVQSESIAPVEWHVQHIAGGLVDRIGRRGSLMLLGALLMIPCYLVLGFTMVPPWLPMLLLGAAFVLVPAAMWPAVPLIVEKNRVGTAFGLMTMIQNIGLAFFPWMNGRLRVLTHTYESSMVMFATLGAAGFVFALLLLRADKRAGSPLEHPERAVAA